METLDLCRAPRQILSHHLTLRGQTAHPFPRRLNLLRRLRKAFDDTWPSPVFIHTSGRSLSQDVTGSNELWTRGLTERLPGKNRARVGNRSPSLQFCEKIAVRAKHGQKANVEKCEPSKRYL
ncbi:MAG: hypothetical protein Q9160_004755 [Pyrenula sp. 1 TL-2023]